MADEPKAADFTFSDGRQVTFDLGKITRAQWLSFVRGGLEQADDDATLAAVSGCTVELIQSLGLDEWKRLSVAFIKKVAAPLSDPN